MQSDLIDLNLYYIHNQKYLLKNLILGYNFDGIDLSLNRETLNRIDPVKFSLL